ncbi:MAG: AMP-binding protein [Candidatus Acidiferrales bacterium]
MARQSLLEYFQPDSRPASEIAVTWRRGYRMARWTYAELLGTAQRFARELGSQGVAKGDRVLLWGENSGEWLAAFLGCLFAGAVAVPMDAIADKNFAVRVARQAGVRLAVIGRELSLGATQEFAQKLGMPTVELESLGQAAGQQPASGFSSPPLLRSDPIEIVFTSGTTSEPRGVVLTHGNLLANLEPLEKEIDRYRRYERFFHPLRFLDLLPLSHVFGQLLGIFLPQILGGTSVFLDTLNPAEVIRVIHDERVSVLVTVPRLIESLQDQIERDLAARGEPERFQRDFEKGVGEHFLRRWWRFRAIHRRFGWKFWAVISGGAALPATAEKFWGRLGYAVVQGYGLTETTSLVSVNHPFRLGQGSIGKTLPGLQVKLSETGEILVRGENVALGYWKESGIATVLDADGWFHTGDLGERDEAGNLYFKGRQKNVIVTPEGLNIYPEDLEAELRKELEVRDCIVIGLERDGNAEPCAVLLLREAANAGEIIRRANSRLAPFQQMRHWAVWHGLDFPRTPTQKPVLMQIREAVTAELGVDAQRAKTTARSSAPSDVADMLQKISRGAATQTSGAELQLSSIERVELMSALEDRYQVDLSEEEFSNAKSAADIEKLVERADVSGQPGGGALADHSLRGPVFRYARWPRWRPVRWIRALAFYFLVRPAMLLLGWPRVRGRENLRGLKGPVLIVSNHITYIDPGFVLTALPARLRWRTAVAMGGERLAALRNPPAGTGIFSGLLGRVQYPLVVALFHVFPLPMRGGFRKSFAFAGELVDRGWSVLIFPEGELTPDGAIAPFRAGIGLLATSLRIPVVPVRLEGLFDLREANKHWTSAGHIRVTVGAPITFSERADSEEITRELERRVRALVTE